MTKSISKLSRGYLHREPRFLRFRRENIGRLERGISFILGAGLVALGMGRRRRLRRAFPKIAFISAASALIGRGLTGKSGVYRAMHVSST
jgi:hypothetical protein